MVNQSMNYFTCFELQDACRFSQKQEQTKDNSYWASYNNVHYFSSHIQQKVQESKGKPVSELTNWDWS
jgi:glucose-6-phosphate isomerase